MDNLTKVSRSRVLDYCVTRNLEELDTDHLKNIHNYLQEENAIDMLFIEDKYIINKDLSKYLTEIQDIINRRQTLINLIK